MKNVENAIRLASNRWIENFNAGNLDGIAAGYRDNAIMVAKPKGTFQGLEEIEKFWKMLLEAGYGALEYSNVEIRVLSETKAVLSADWKMNLASGVITNELWEKQEDGNWKLLEDHFEIQNQIKPNDDSDDSKTALLIIDLQKDYFEGGKMELNQTEKTASNAGKLLKEFRNLNLPRIHVRHVFTSCAVPFFSPGTEGSEIHPSVQPNGDETVIVKNYVNSFHSTNLDQELKSLGVKRLIICGAMTHMCIDSAVRSASELGYHCVVPEDACTTTGAEFKGRAVSAEDVHATVMAALEFAFAEVTTTDSILKKLQSSVVTA